MPQARCYGFTLKECLDAYEYHYEIRQFILSKLAKAVMCMVCIWDMPHSNLGQETNYDFLLANHFKFPGCDCPRTTLYAK
jgi:hypothetical protein